MIRCCQQQGGMQEEKNKGERKIHTPTSRKRIRPRQNPEAFRSKKASVALPKKATHEVAFSCDTSSGKAEHSGCRAGYATGAHPRLGLDLTQRDTIREQQQYTRSPNEPCGEAGGSQYLLQAITVLGWQLKGFVGSEHETVYHTSSMCHLFM